MQGQPFRIATLALVGLPLALGSGCSSNAEPEGGLDSGANGGRGTAARGGSNNASGSGNTTGGTSANGGSAAADSGGTSATSGTSGTSASASGGTSTTGSGGSGGFPSAACEGLPYGSAEGGGAGDDACIGVGAEAEPVPVDLFIMMDRSDSMANEIPGTGRIRWDALREAVQAFAEAASGDDDIRAGIGFFGRTGGNDDVLDCDAGYYAEPKVEIGPLAEVGEDLVSALDETFPGGLTPT